MHEEITIPELTEVVSRVTALLGPREGSVIQLEGGHETLRVDREIGLRALLPFPQMMQVPSVPTIASPSDGRSTGRISSKPAVRPPSNRIRASATTPIVRASS